MLSFSFVVLKFLPPQLALAFLLFSIPTSSFFYAYHAPHVHHEIDQQEVKQVETFPSTELEETTGTLPIECEEYLQKMSRCYTHLKIPADTQGTITQALQQTRKGWLQAAKTPEGFSSLKTTCKSIINTAKQSTKNMGCQW